MFDSVESPAPSPASNRFDLSRREVVGGGLLLGLMALTGCETTMETAALPGPVYPTAATRGPVLGAPPPAPAVTPRVTTGGSLAVVPRYKWTSAQFVRYRSSSKNAPDLRGDVRRITVHHDSNESGSLTSTSAVARRIESIRSYHVNTKKWNDIGYHYIIDPQGRIWEGRHISHQGAHVSENNENNLGIMLLGNFDWQTPTPESLSTLDRFIAQQMNRYRIGLSRVFTHQEIKKTACPGVNLQRYMVVTRSSGGNLRRFTA